jgi:hypothetical protein
MNFLSLGHKFKLKSEILQNFELTTIYCTRFNPKTFDTTDCATDERILTTKMDLTRASM